MKILILRLSAMGDVAMCVPLMKAVTEQHPDHEYFFLTRQNFAPFFTKIKKLALVHPELNGKHKGISGIFKLCKKLRKEINPDLIIDLHDVLRTKSVRLLFRLIGIQSFTIHKGRKEKRKLVAKKNKKRKQLKHTVERYADTFRKAGFDLILSTKQSDPLKASGKKQTQSIQIGVAPFAKHFQKQYPLELMSEVIKQLDAKNYNILIFGGGQKEKSFADELENNLKNAESMIGKMSFQEEVKLISKLNLMLTMDSGNMHIAALSGIKTVSVWGATHPYAGFAPFTFEENSYIVQDKDLDCRPCSVFGNKSCYKKTLECMYNIKPEEIVSACEKAIES